MMRNKYLLPLLTAVMLAAATTAGAKKTTVPKMYMFGMAAAFTDTIVHFTPIQELDSVWVESKNGFLLSRDNYSYQLRDYLSSQLQMPHRTCIVVYDRDRKKMEKKYLKMKRLYTQPKPGAQHYDVRYVGESDFHFQTIDESAYLEMEENLLDKPRKKKGKRGE